jgi:RNA polymerase sigma-70 factor (ECF subfamily)
MHQDSPSHPDLVSNDSPEVRLGAEKISHSKINDESLIIKIAQGDRSAFSTFYDRFSVLLYSLAYKILAEEAEAQELLKETFIWVWNNAASFRSERNSAFSWVVSHLRKRAIDQIRSPARRSTLREAEACRSDPNGYGLSKELTGHCGTGTRAHKVRSVMERLPEDQRQILRLAFFEGLSLIEIAEKLEQPVVSVKANAHGGVAHLRELLAYPSPPTSAAPLYENAKLPN